MDYSFDNKNILKHNCQWTLNNSLAHSFEQEQNVFWEEQYWTSKTFVISTYISKSHPITPPIKVSVTKFVTPITWGKLKMNKHKELWIRKIEYKIYLRRHSTSRIHLTSWQWQGLRKVGIKIQGKNTFKATTLKAMIFHL
jgi:uncharacterized protein YpiB (UPF0302 family)